MFLLPALIVMAVITFYPLVFQVWMSFTDYGLKNLRSTAPAPAYVGIDNYLRILENNIVIVELRLRAGPGLQPLVGLLERGHPRRAGRDRGDHPEHPRACGLKRFYRAIFILPVVIPPIIVATVWRNMFDPTHGAINFLLQDTIGILFQLPPGSFNMDWLNQPNPIIAAGAFMLPLAYFALLTANVWLGWPLNSVVATGAPPERSRTTCTRRPRWTARARGPSSRR